MALITELPASTSLASTDLLIKDNGSTTQKITATNLISGLLGSANFSAMTLTRTENSYVDATSFGRLRGYRCGRIGIIYFNLQITTALPHLSDFLEIGRVSPNLFYSVLQTIPSQTGNGILTLQITNTGIINIYTDSTSVSGFCRASIPVFLTL